MSVAPSSSAKSSCVVSATALMASMIGAAPFSMNSCEPLFEWLRTVQVVPGCSMQSSTASAAVTNENPMRALFTAPLKRESSSIHRCWYGLSCSTGGRLSLDGREPKGPLTETIDVVDGELPAFPDFLCCFIRFFLGDSNNLFELLALQLHALFRDVCPLEPREHQRQPF